MVTVAFALSGKDDDLSAGGTSGGKKIADTRNLLITQPTINDDGEAQESPSFVDRLSGSARLIGLLERLGKGSTTQVSTSVMTSLKQLSTQFQNQTAIPVALLAQPENADQNSRTLVQSTAQAATQQAQSVNTTNNLNNSLAGVLAKQVSAAVENSGLFYESHLQQWVNGQRSTDQIAQEPQARFGQDQVISEKGLNPAAVEQSVKMVTAQLATLDNNRISLALSGLLGHPVQIDIEPDPEEIAKKEENQNEEAARPWIARLKLDMPHLGELNVRVRMVGSHCDVQITGPARSKQAIDPHWQSFRQAMDDKGLKLVHGQFMVPTGFEIGE